MQGQFFQCLDTTDESYKLTSLKAIASLSAVTSCGPRFATCCNSVAHDLPQAFPVVNYIAALKVPIDSQVQFVVLGGCEVNPVAPRGPKLVRVDAKVPAACVSTPDRLVRRVLELILQVTTCVLERSVVVPTRMVKLKNM